MNQCFIGIYACFSQRQDGDFFDKKQGIFDE